jgi:hypothetical protein
MKNNRVPLLSAREKMPFQVTPLMPYLARYDPRTVQTVEGVGRTPSVEARAAGPVETVASDRRDSR